MSACRRVCVSACLRVCIYMYVNMYVCMYVCMYVSMYLCMYVCIYVCLVVIVMRFLRQTNPLVCPSSFPNNKLNNFAYTAHKLPTEEGSECVTYDPSQEPIFPSELQVGLYIPQLGYINITRAFEAMYVA